MPNVRSRCLATIVKLLAIASPSQLQTVLVDLPISSFIAGLMSGRDTKAQAVAIQMAEILMSKLPAIFAGFFVKEGVAHALERLSSVPAAPAASVGLGGGAVQSGNASTVSAAAVDRVSAAASHGRRSSVGGGRHELPPPSPPVTRSRRSSRAEAVSSLVLRHVNRAVAELVRPADCPASYRHTARLACIGQTEACHSPTAGACRFLRQPSTCILSQGKDVQNKEEPREQPTSPAAAPAVLERPTGIESMRSGSFTLKSAVARRAAAFREQHFSGNGAGCAAVGMESEGLQQLKQLCDKLSKDDTCITKVLEVS